MEWMDQGRSDEPQERRTRTPPKKKQIKVVISEDETETIPTTTKKREDKFNIQERPCPNLLIYISAKFAEKTLADFHFPDLATRRRR